MAAGSHVGKNSPFALGVGINPATLRGNSHSMGFRLRRRIRVLPGLWMNISKTGPLSLSAGIRGITANWGRKGTSLTGSVHGSGLSYRTKLRRYRWWVFAIVFAVVVLLVLLAGV